MSFVKYKIREVASDFGLQPKDIAAIVEQYFEKPRSNMQVLTDEQLNVVFDVLTQRNQISSLEVIWAAAFAAQAEKEAAEKKAKEEAAAKKAAETKKAPPAGAQPAKPAQNAKPADKGGVTGINFCGAFLDPGEKPYSSVHWMGEHIEHIRQVAGIDAIALGSDFDGIEPDVEMGNCSGMPMLADELHRRGYSDDEIEKIFHGNALRILKEFLPEA